MAVKTIAILLAVYLVLCLALAGCQRQVIYYPSNATEERLLGQAQRMGLSAWRNKSGELIGWRASSSSSAKQTKAVVVFHGNAGHALMRDYFADGFLALEGGESWTVFLFEYPGYGARSGIPSEERFQKAAIDAVTPLFEEYEHIYLAGESIGTGVATYVASRYPDQIDGLLLITPFTSLVEVGKKHYPIFPIDLLLRNRFDNAKNLRSYPGPTAFLVAGQDEIIPNSLSFKLFENYSGTKRLWVQEDAGHNTLNYAPQASWWQEVVIFLADSGNHGGE